MWVLLKPLRFEGAKHATQHFGRFWGEADINWQTKPAGSVENDPKQTFGSVLAVAITAF
jgi:hypothetical protein